MIKARNLKFGMYFDHESHDEYNIRSQRDWKGVTWPTFRIVGHLPYLGNGWSYPLRSINMLNLRFVSSAISEILRDPQIWKVGRVT